MVKYLFQALYEDENENGTITKPTTLGLGLVLTFLEDKGALINYYNWRNKPHFRINYFNRELDLAISNSDTLSIYSLVPCEHLEHGQVVAIKKDQWDEVYEAFRKEDLSLKSTMNILSEFVFQLEYKFYKLILHHLLHGIRFRSIFDDSDSEDYY